MSGQDTTAPRHWGVPSEEIRAACAKIGPTWWLTQVDQFYAQQRAYTLNEDDDGGAGAGLLWLLHGDANIPPERFANDPKARAKAEATPEEARLVQLKMDLLSLTIDTPTIRERGVIYGLDLSRKDLARTRLDNEGRLPAEVVDGDENPCGFALSLVEIGPDEAEYASLYLANSSGQTWIWRVAMTGANKGNMLSEFAQLDMDDIHAMEHQAINGQVHPYMVTLFQTYVVIAVDGETLTQRCRQEIDQAVRELADGTISGFQVNGVTVTTGDLPLFGTLLGDTE